MNTIDTILAVICSIFILCVVPLNFKKKTYAEVKRALLLSAIEENAEDVFYLEELAEACDIKLKNFMLTLEGERGKEFYPCLYYADTYKEDIDCGVNRVTDKGGDLGDGTDLYFGRVILYGY